MIIYKLAYSRPARRHTISHINKKVKPSQRLVNLRRRVFSETRTINLCSVSQMGASICKTSVFPACLATELGRGLCQIVSAGLSRVLQPELAAINLGIPAMYGSRGLHVCVLFTCFAVHFVLSRFMRVMSDLFILLTELCPHCSLSMKLSHLNQRIQHQGTIKLHNGNL